MEPASSPLGEEDLPREASTKLSGSARVKAVTMTAS